MKTRDRPKKRRASLKTRAKRWLAGGLMLAFAGAVLDNWADRGVFRSAQENNAPQAGAGDLCNAFGRLNRKDAEVAAIDQVIAKIETGETSDMVLLAIASGDYARSRGYNRNFTLAPDAPSPVLANMVWDLRVLGYYEDDTPRTFTSDVDTALRAFQKDMRLPQTGQADSDTLRTLGARAYQQRMLIGLHAWKTSIREDIPLKDLLTLIALEASFNPHAGARTSSARGIGQFVTWTWMEMIAHHGGDLGLAAEQRQARAILVSRERSEGFSTDQQANMERILAMRTNYAIAIPLIARYARKNMTGPFSVEKAYIPYVLGPGGERTMRANLQATGHDTVRAIARANRSFFYERVPKKNRKGEAVKDRNGFTVMVWGKPFTNERAIANIIDRTRDPRIARDVEATVGIMQSLSDITEPGNWPQCRPSPAVRTAGGHAPIQVN